MTNRMIEGNAAGENSEKVCWTNKMAKRKTIDRCTKKYREVEMLEMSRLPKL